MKDIIKRILNEENSLQSKLMQMMKTKGVDLTSEVVGGFDNLNKILKLDLDDINVQEMLVKNFINFVEIPEIEVTGLEIKNSSSGNRVINILFTTESNASNIESWLVRDIIEYLSGFFPFPIKAVWEPSFGGNIKISLSSELVKEDEDGNITESVLSENKSKENVIKKMFEDLGISKTIKLMGGIDSYCKKYKINTPIEYLQSLPKMKFFPSVNEIQRKLGWKALKFKKEGFAYFIYDPEEGYLHINYEEVFLPIEKHFKINFNEFKDVIREWIPKEYDINKLGVVG
jgi:hypothetical protein